MNAISVIVLVFKLPVFLSDSRTHITHPANVVGVDDIDLKTKGRQRRWEKRIDD